MYNFHWFFKLVNTNGTLVRKDETFSFVCWTQMHGAAPRCVASWDPAGLLRLFSSPLWPVWKLNPRRSKQERAATQIPVIGNRWVAPTQRRPKTHPHPSVSKHTLGKNMNGSMPLYSLKTLEVKSIYFLSFKWCGRRCPWVGLRGGWGSAGCDCKAGNWRASSATANQR